MAGACGARRCIDEGAQDGSTCARAPTRPLATVVGEESSDQQWPTNNRVGESETIDTRRVPP